MHSSSPSSHAGAGTGTPTGDEPPRKKSKWADLADEEDKAAARERKRIKKAELELKLAREKEIAKQHAGASGTAGTSASGASSREGTPGTQSRLAGAGGMRAGRGRPRGRVAHPLLESCRSVYCYEVRHVILYQFIVADWLFPSA